MKPPTTAANSDVPAERYLAPAMRAVRDGICSDPEVLVALFAYVDSHRARDWAGRERATRDVAAAWRNWLFYGRARDASGLEDI